MSELIKRYQLYQSITQEYLDKIFNLSIDEQRFFYHSNKISKSFESVSIAEYDDKICYSKTTKIISFNGKFYIRDGKKEGFTYNKVTKKVSIWFGAKIQRFLPDSHFLEFLKIYNYDWLSNEPYLIKLLTKSNLEKVMSGKITNPIQLSHYYLRTSLKSKASTKLFYSYLKIYDFKNNGCDPLYFLKEYFKICDNQDNVLKKLTKLEPLYKHLPDLVNQCLILNRKINFNWSEKRLDVEHKKLTNELIQIELKYLGDYIINYNGSIVLPNDCELLTTQKEVFTEGYIQKHCVYTSYWSSIKINRYFVIRMHLPERCTIGIRYQAEYKDYQTEEIIPAKFILCQMYKYSNTSVTEETRNIILEWLKLPSTQEFFSNNYDDVKESKQILNNNEILNLAVYHEEEVWF